MQVIEEVVEETSESQTKGDVFYEVRRHDEVR